MQFERAHALVQQGQGEAVAAAFAQALRSPGEFLRFLGVTDTDALRQSQLRAGQFVADLLQVAQLRPSAFRGLFEALYRQGVRELGACFKDVPPAELWARLFLCSFMAQLSGLDGAVQATEALAVQVCAHYLDFYQGQLPDAYAHVLGEFGVFPLIAAGKPEQAWALERRANHLATLLERDGPGLLDLAAMLFNLHSRFDAGAPSLAQTRELMALRFGEEEVSQAIKKCRLE